MSPSPHGVSLTPIPLNDLAHGLQRHLLEDVIAFWTRHALDPDGGLNTCIRDDGSIISRDKFMWSQLRAIYTFSALYNHIERRQEWLDIAAQIFRFCAKHGRDDQGHWVFRVGSDGRIIEGATSIFAESFALLGCCEYFRAAGDTSALGLAKETYESTTVRLAVPGSYQIAPYEIPPGLEAHAISMAFSFAFHELAVVTNDDRVRQSALAHALKVMDRYRRPERKALLEYVRPDGSLEDSPAGRVVIPGHAIESMWFQIHQFQHLGMHDRVTQCIECIRWNMELGWDSEFGGISLGLDLEGKHPIYWKFHDAKLWWPQTEALYALLLAHSICGEPWCLEWYWRLHEVAFRHYPVFPHGEWTQRLDRRFKPFDGVVALPVKDPFHLPRALIVMIKLLRQQR
jgi:N-acylglucosamine 2-epimerase